VQVFVLGMHRSGTSLLSRLVHELGLFVGEAEELMPAQPCNVEGFWERLDVSELNEQLLELAGGSWDCPPPLRSLEATWSRAENGEVAAACDRARAIAWEAGVGIGAITNADTGTFQITAPNSTEASDTGSYDTRTIDKAITAVMAVTFRVE